MSPPQVENCVYMMKKYLKGKLDLHWHDGVVKVKKKRKRKSLRNDNVALDHIE